MTERLSPDDMAFLVTESASTPMHNATLDIFAPPRGGFDYDRLLGLIADRIAFVPRYRQRLRNVPGRLALPVWVDDDAFDLTYHVRRSALPRPGSMHQLRDLVARVLPSQLDRDRPLWEIYLIEGLEDGRFALLTKSHQILVDGVSTIDLGQVILDVHDTPRETVHDDWHPRPVPPTPVLVAEAVAESVRHPWSMVDTAQVNALGALRSVASLGARLRDAGEALAGRRTTPDSPVNVALSRQRRFTSVSTRLEDYRVVRRAHGGTVNDVILATVAGGLRGWLMTRAEPVPSSRSMRAMVPMSVIDNDLEPTSLGSQVTGHLLSLPIGETSPVVRLHQLSYALKAHKEAGRAVAADRLAGVAGFAPTTFHALGARVAAVELRRGFNLVVTNVPGPQFPLYAAGAEMLESYPAPPLLPGHALAIGVTSYDGGVYFGLTADRDAVPDLDVLAQCLVEALEELVETASEARQRAPRPRDEEEAGPAVSGTRVYVPSSWAGLRDLVLSGGLGPSPLLAHAVTAELRAAWPDAGEEDQEYAAMSAAARTSLACIGPEDVQRRVVIAVDADTVLQGRHQDVTVVELGEAVPYRRVAAVLTDSTDAETAVAAARAAWPAAQAGDPGAEAVVDRCQDHELGWYAAQELGDLLER